MNRKNKILLGCLSLLLVLTAGYALFSENITINGTATAKGDFNITPTCIAGTVVDVASLGIDKEGGYKNEICTADDATDTISFSAEFEYPGALRYYTIKLTNTGTITSKVPEEISLVQGQLCVADTLEKDAKTQGDCVDIAPHYSNSLMIYAAQVGDGKIYIGDDADQILPEFTENDVMVLKPGNSLYYLTVLGALDMEGNILNMYSNYVYKPIFEQLTN